MGDGKMVPHPLSPISHPLSDIAEIAAAPSAFGKSGRAFRGLLNERLEAFARFIAQSLFDAHSPLAIG